MSLTIGDPNVTCRGFVSFCAKSGVRLSFDPVFVISPGLRCRSVIGEVVYRRYFRTI